MAAALVGTAKLGTSFALAFPSRPRRQEEDCMRMPICVLVAACVAFASSGCGRRQADGYARDDVAKARAQASKDIPSAREQFGQPPDQTAALAGCEPLDAEARQTCRAAVEAARDAANANATARTEGVR
jgi:hypothetical protein